MKRIAVAILVTLSIVSFAMITSARKQADVYPDEYTLLNFVEMSDIVCTGTVVHIDSMVRDGFMTDIFVRLDTLIKGKANMGNNHVIFMIMGGVGYSETDGELLELNISSEPTFQLKEDVMLFLRKETDLKDGRYKNYAHGTLHVIEHAAGKKSILNNSVEFKYFDANEEFRPVKFSLDLATSLATAFMKDAEAAKTIEGEIKRLVFAGTNTISHDLEKQLIEKTKQIIDKPEEDE